MTQVIVLCLIVMVAVAAIQAQRQRSIPWVIAAILGALAIGIITRR